MVVSTTWLYDLCLSQLIMQVAKPASAAHHSKTRRDSLLIQLSESSTRQKDIE